MTESTKGYDDSPPRNGVIAFYTVLAVAVLIGTTFLLDSYFARIMQAEIHEKVLTRGLDVAIDAKARESAALEKSGIGNAMRSLAQGRGSSALIAPQSGSNKTAVEGWSQLKRQLPSAPQTAPAPEAAPAPAPAVAPATPPAGSTTPAAPGTAAPTTAPGTGALGDNPATPTRAPTAPRAKPTSPSMTPQGR